MMRPLVLALLLVLTLSGFTCSRTVQRPPAPVPAQCDAQCFVECPTRIPAWSPSNPDSPDAWTDLGDQVLAPAKDLLDRCELNRKACHQCIDRLKREGVLL